VRHASSLIIVL